MLEAAEPPPPDTLFAVEAQLQHSLDQCCRDHRLTHAEDVAYLGALKLVVSEALQWLRGGRQGAGLFPLTSWAGGRRAKAILAGSTSSGDLDGIDSALRLQEHRRDICAALAGGRVSAERTLRDALRAAGGALYAVLIRRAFRDIEGRRLIRESLALDRHYIDEMRRTIAAADRSEESRSARFEIAIRKAVQLRRGDNRNTPRLILVHDIDRNLTASEDHYAHFPLFDLWSRIHQLHREMDLGPPEARFAALSIFGANHPNVRDAWDSQLRQMGRRLPGMLLSDARELFAAEAARPNGLIESCFVTGNNTTVAAQMAESLGLPGARIWGVDETGVDGFDKPLAVLEIIRENPGAIVVVSDDGDPELVRAVQESLVGDDRAAGFADLLLFVAREPNGDETYTYSLGPALAKAGLPFLSNVLQKGPGIEVGYQGMNQVVDLYQSLITR
jgi:hypothetical protein